MQIAYLIITHSMPDHFARLIHALSDDETDFYVHVNNRVPIRPFLRYRFSNVFFLEQRMSVFWGEWQFVEAAINLIRRALESNREYGYLVLLSGSCYPIRSKEYIQQLLVENHGYQFISAIKMPNHDAKKSLSRLEHFSHRSDLPMIEFYRRFAKELISNSKLGLPYPPTKWGLQRNWRQALGSLAPYGGAAWWALTSDACRYVSDFVSREQGIVRFFENTIHASEMFFQTILANSPFASQLRPSLMYADWSEGGCHPAEISEEHVAMFAQRWPLIEDGFTGKGEKCFARKFPDDGGRIAGMVDELVRQHKEEYSHAYGSTASSPLLATI